MSRSERNHSQTRRAEPVWAKLTPRQQDVLSAAARQAAGSNDAARLADEKAITETLKNRGLAVDAIDLAPFRTLADKTYAEADAAKAWDAALLKRVVAAR